jgi:tetratricopeptide (TPR) repeat protein
VWGLFGILEYALLTENITNMEVPLEVLQMLAQQDATAVPSWAIPHYSAWYHISSGRFEEVEKILPLLAQEKKVNPLDLAELKVGLALRKNRFEEAQRALNDLPPEYRKTQDASALEAEILWLKDGPEQSMKYLSEKVERHPNWWLIKRWHASALIEIGQHQKGLDLLMSLAQSRPFDLPLQVDLIRNWTYYGGKIDSKEIEEYVDRALRNSLNNAQLPSYRVLIADDYAHQGRHEEAKKEFARVKELHPKSPDLLWVTYYYYRDRQEYDSASRALKELLEVDPHDVSALVSRMQLSYLRGAWEEVFEVEKALTQSPRYISEQQRNEIRSYKALTFARQGKKKEAREVLAAIKDPTMRADVSAKIKSPPKQGRKKIVAAQEVRASRKVRNDKECRAVIQGQKAQFIFPLPGMEEFTWHRSQTQDNALEYAWEVSLEGLHPKYNFNFGIYLFKFPGRKEKTGGLVKLISKAQASVWDRATTNVREDLPIERLIDGNKLLILVSNSATFEALFAHKPTIAHCRVHTPYKQLNFETSTRIEYLK